MSRIDFRLEATSPGSRARAGRFNTLHGEVATPVFMPVGTQASVRGLLPTQLASAGSQVILSNTYHLMLRPGIEVFRHFGGIHNFMGWNGPLLTDSGGYQIFSLPNSRAMSEEGADFASYVDGRIIRLSPESSIGMQRAIGSDIMMVLDQCVPSTADHATAKTAMELTQRWAVRSLAARGDSPQALFGIVQGACHADLRRQSAEQLSALPFDGLAIGGLAVGETKSERDDFTELVTDFLPADRPRYLMGVGTPLDLLEAVHRGVDMFDCILPISLAQRGVVYTTGGRLQLRRGVYKYDERVIDPGCTCPTCQGWSRGYFHHLIKAGETLGWSLLGLHNLHFYHNHMAAMRRHILAGTFADYYRTMRVELAREDDDNPPCPTPPLRKPKALRQSQLGDYEVLPDLRGGDFASIRQISSGEVMHSVSDPVEEARRLYVEQAGLAGLLAGDSGSASSTPTKAASTNADRPLVIWDVGLGAATNAMAGVACWETLRRGLVEGRSIRGLRLVSFERDLDPLRLAVRNAARFPHLHHPGPAALLKNAIWQHADGLDWQLLEGDFLERLPQAPRPALVWYDPFSFKTDGVLWHLSTFRRLAAAWGDGPEIRLYTYSASTAVRATLLAAGFWVARGEPTGPKSETTIAILPSAGQSPSTDPAAGPRLDLLGPEWLARWERSGSPWPADLSEADRPVFAETIRRHPQFL